MCHIHIDIRGEDLSQNKIINLIKGLFGQHEALSQRLQSDENSDIVFYFTGHSGDEFFKVQDSQVLYARDIGTALDIAYKKKMYRRILFISDTCEAFSWFKYVQAPNIIFQASSGEGENAYSHGFDAFLKTFTSDKYTFLFAKYLNSTYHEIFAQTSLKKFFEHFDRIFLDSSPVYTNSAIKRCEYENCPNLLTYQNNGTEIKYDKFQDSVYASDIPMTVFFPPPFTINDRKDKAMKYSIST